MEITLTGNVDGYFKDGLVGGYQELYTGDWVLNHPFTIDGKVATLIAETEYYNSVEVHGEFVVGAPTPANLLTYATTWLTYDTTELTGDVTITDKQGTDAEHFDITVTGNGDGTFNNLTAVYTDIDGYWCEDPFNVSGNVGTITVYCNKGDEIAITGEFVSGDTPEPPTPTTLLSYDATGLTGDVTITDQQGTDDYHFNVTVTGNGDGTFSNLKQRIKIGMETILKTNRLPYRVTLQHLLFIVPKVTKSR